MRNKKETLFDQDFREDLAFWIKNDQKIALKILSLVEEIERNPVQGRGKPERLKYLGENLWSRRITQEHRLVYMVSENKIFFLQCKYHY